MIHSASGAPADYAELHEHYYGFVRSLVIKAGIRIEDADDVTQEMLCKFMEKDALAWYDGDKLHTHAGGVQRKARFATFLAGFVGKYVLAARDRQMRNQRREVYGDSEAGIDAMGDAMEQVEIAEWVRAAEAHLAAIPVRGRRDLARAFRMAVSQVVLDGKTDRKVIAAEFGISDTAVCSIFKDMRRELEAAGFKAVL